MPDRVRMVAVLVLYGRSLENSLTWNYLANQVDPALHQVAEFHLLICDNGPLEGTQPPLPAWARYVGVHRNLGLAWAYNLGRDYAKECEADWFITLDQDTEVPPDFLLRMAALAAALSDRPEVAAIAPQLISEAGMVYSPAITGWFGERRTETGFRGVGAGDVRAFNSASMVRVLALDAVGGYDRRFWLDYLDHALFRSLNRQGYQVWVAGDVQILHHLSLRDDRVHLTEDRFGSFSAAESAFRDLYASRWEGLIFSLRLLLRAANQKRRGDPAHFFRTTLSILKQRLFLSRKERIRRWELQVAPMMAQPEIVIQVEGSSGAEV